MTDDAMPTLILLNGPPGIGKSTLAARYAADHPLTLCLDIDLQRRLIGRWEELPDESGRLARDLATAMIRTHLAAGHDVVVPQYVASADAVDLLAATAAECGSGFAHVVLTAPRAQARQRFVDRADDPARSAHHAEALRQIDGAGGYEQMYDAMAAFRLRRVEAFTVPTRTDDPDEAYRHLVAVVSALTPSLPA